MFSQQLSIIVIWIESQTGTSKMQQSVYMRRLLDALIITHDTTNAR